MHASPEVEGAAEIGDVVQVTSEHGRDDRLETRRASRSCGVLRIGEVRAAGHPDGARAPRLACCPGDRLRAVLSFVALRYEIAFRGARPANVLKDQSVAFTHEAQRVERERSKGCSGLRLSVGGTNQDRRATGRRIWPKHIRGKHHAVAHGHGHVEVDDGTRVKTVQRRRLYTTTWHSEAVHRELRRNSRVSKLSA